MFKYYQSTAAITIAAILASTVAIVKADGVDGVDLEALVSANYPQLRSKLSPLIDQFKELDRPDYDKLTSAMGDDTLPEKFDAKIFDRIEDALGGEAKIKEMMSVLGLDSLTEGLSIPAPTGSHEVNSDGGDSSKSKSGNGDDNLKKDDQEGAGVVSFGYNVGVLGTSLAVAAVGLSYF
ncbi:hypothetical protein H4219_002573 [Mycoemilia scoparia]|uniref:Uncharacterized protein n=1 Tax=Mycoemilia scoparia TaxID=417184 RepID=A0A9W8DQE2_9FUNG|nr:hypothetical protein H4219_002573 [Mycoemilia scoparia]